MAATIPELLDRKRWGGRLSRSELEQLLGGYLRGDVPDYQMSAWLMAVCCLGMDQRELADLTELMAFELKREGMDVSAGRSLAPERGT